MNAPFLQYSGGITPVLVCAGVGAGVEGFQAAGAGEGTPDRQRPGHAHGDLQKFMWMRCTLTQILKPIAKSSRHSET